LADKGSVEARYLDSNFVDSYLAPISLEPIFTSVSSLDSRQQMAAVCSPQHTGTSHMVQAIATNGIASPVIKDVVTNVGQPMFNPVDTTAVVSSNVVDDGVGRDALHGAADPRHARRAHSPSGEQRMRVVSPERRVCVPAFEQRMVQTSPGHRSLHGAAGPMHARRPRTPAGEQLAAATRLAWMPV
jgi:hypothetical protein